MTARTEFVPVRMTPDEKAAALQAATLMETTISDLVRLALVAYLETLADADARRLHKRNEDYEHNNPN